MQADAGTPTHCPYCALQCGMRVSADGAGGRPAASPKCGGRHVAACDLWHDSYVLVVLAVAALAVLGCVVAVALGHGGEMTEFPPDVPPLDLPEAGQLTAVDFMSLRIPVALVGYHTQSVDETLRPVEGA